MPRHGAAVFVAAAAAASVDFAVAIDVGAIGPNGWVDGWCAMRPTHIFVTLYMHAMADRAGADDYFTVFG